MDPVEIQKLLNKIEALELELSIARDLLRGSGRGRVDRYRAVLEHIADTGCRWAPTALHSESRKSDESSSSCRCNGCLARSVLLEI